MSIQLMSEVWPLDLPAGRKFVLLSLCDTAHDDGDCFVCVETLAFKCGMGIRTVQEHLSALEADGFLRREERAGRSSMFYLFPMVIRAADRHPLYEKRQAIRERLTSAKSAGVCGTPAESAPLVAVETPAESAPLTAKTPAKSAGGGANFAGAPADFAPITVTKQNSNQQSLTAGEPTTMAAFAMTLDWQPNPNYLETYAKHQGVQLTEFNPDLIAEFTAHWSADGSFKTEAQWVQKLVQRAKTTRGSQRQPRTAAARQRPATAQQTNFRAGLNADGSMPA